MRSAVVGIGSNSVRALVVETTGGAGKGRGFLPDSTGPAT